MQLAQEMAKLPELQSLTFESNIIRDEEAICALFSNLRGYDRLENLNIRENHFSSNVVNALATGIQDKRELRVSKKRFFLHAFFAIGELNYFLIVRAYSRFSVDCGPWRELNRRCWGAKTG